MYFEDSNGAEKGGTLCFFVRFVKQSTLFEELL